MRGPGHCFGQTGEPAAPSGTSLDSLLNSTPREVPMRKLSTFGNTAWPDGVVGRRARLRTLVGTGILALTGLIGVAGPAAAGPLIDPNTLQPVPPNATCRDDGRQIICDTFLEEFAVDEPNSDFDLPCGTIYETSYYRGDGTRWYEDRLAVKRHVAASL